MGFKLTPNEETLIAAAEAQGWKYTFPGVGYFGRIAFSRDESKSEARTRERIEAVVDAIQGNPEEGKGLVTNGQLYGEITDLKIEMDNARARELDAIKAEMEKIKADLRTLFNDRP